jgi:hypothetical protein
VAGGGQRRARGGGGGAWADETAATSVVGQFQFPQARFSIRFHGMMIVP